MFTVVVAALAATMAVIALMGRAPRAATSKRSGVFPLNESSQF
jgi:hypothetical protein